MKRLLVIGAIPDYKNNLQFGGATVLTKVLLDYLTENHIDFDFAQTNKYSNKKRGRTNSILSTIYFFCNFIIKIWRADIVMFNFSDHGVATLFPLLSAIVRKLHKKVVLRKFGGSFEIFLKKIPQKTKANTLKAIESSDLILFETKSGINHLKTLIDASDKIMWYPNVRKPSIYRRDPEIQSNSLVFMGHICDEKGVSDLLKLSNKLKSRFNMHVYGAIKENKYLNFNWSEYSVTYHGEIKSEEVTKILSESYLLLLMSYREGYPGIIVESLSAGLPVLTTNVGGIPEMIKDGVEGLVVEPGDIESAYNKIINLSTEDYAEMSNYAYKTYVENFDANIVNQKVINRILSL